jgi:hypothetical protein
MLEHDEEREILPLADLDDGSCRVASGAPGCG